MWDLLEGSLETQTFDFEFDERTESFEVEETLEVSREEERREKQ